MIPFLLAQAAPVPLMAQALPASSAAAATVLRPQQVAPLPGGLDPVLMVNDNNPELILEPGILLSTFEGKGRPFPEAHLNLPLNGRFDLFSHHVYAGTAQTLESTLWLAVVAMPRQAAPVQLRLVSGATSLSQATSPGQASAPFLPLPPLLPQDGSTYAGPGDRVTTELLSQQTSPQLPQRWSLPAGQLTPLLVLPIPVKGLSPLLNGINLQLRLESSGPISLATLASVGGDQPPAPEVWQALLNGPLSPKEHTASPRGSQGPFAYSRVSGVQIGSVWRGQVTDPGKPFLSVSRAPISWPISSLVRGSHGTGQVQTAELKASYPGTAWAAHGNYGVEYDLRLPLRNDTGRPVSLQLALESPLKGDKPLGGLKFRQGPGGSIWFRGSLEVAGLDGPEGKPLGREGFHLVLRSGQEGPSLGTVTLAPGGQRQLRLRLIYPADATPPQVLSLLPLAPPANPAASPPAQPAVKQSPNQLASPP